MKLGIKRIKYFGGERENLFAEKRDFFGSRGGFQFVVLWELFLVRKMDLIFDFEHLTVQLASGFGVSGRKTAAVGGIKEKGIGVEI